MAVESEQENRGSIPSIDGADVVSHAAKHRTRKKPSPPATKGRARALRRDSTWAEKLMWRWLRDRRFSAYKFRRQHPIGRYVLDFYCEEARLAIELDGSQHGFPKVRCHDQLRDQTLELLGIKTLRFWNSKMRRQQQMIRDTVFRELQERAPHPLPAYTRPGIAGETRVTEPEG